MNRSLLGLLSILADGVFDPSPPRGWRKGNHLISRGVLSLSSMMSFLFVAWLTTSKSLSLILVSLAACSWMVVRQKGISVRAEFIGRLIAEDCKCCTSCAYPLRGLPDSGSCPECGTVYAARSCQEVWRRWILSPCHRSLAGYVRWKSNLGD